MSEQHTAVPEPSAEDRSKDEFFVRLGDLAEEMISAHGKEFAMGVFIIAARFIAEGKPLKAAPKAKRLQRPPSLRNDGIAASEAARPKQVDQLSLGGREIV